MRSEQQRIRTRQAVDDNGERTSDATVFCPHHRHSVPLAECDCCERCQGVHLDPTGASPYVVCRPPAHLPSDTPTVGQVMTGDVVCVRPEVPLLELTTLLLQQGMSGVPVVDQKGYPVGVVSKSDLVRANFQRLGPTATVAEVMMPVAFTLEETQPLEFGAAFMSVEGVHRLPIVDAQGRVVGVLTALDLVRWLARQTGWRV